jgi:hypothetical protein
MLSNPIHPKPEREVALHFKNKEDFARAVDILWEIRKKVPNLPFALPPAENTFIIPEMYFSYFEKLQPEERKVQSLADLPDEEVTKLRKKYFWPREEKN